METIYWTVFANRPDIYVVDVVESLVTKHKGVLVFPSDDMVLVLLTV